MPFQSAGYWSEVEWGGHQFVWWCAATHQTTCMTRDNCAYFQTLLVNLCTSRTEQYKFHNIMERLIVSLLQLFVSFMTFIVFILKKQMLLILSYINRRSNVGRSLSNQSNVAIACCGDLFMEISFWFIYSHLKSVKQWRSQDLEVGGARGSGGQHVTDILLSNHAQFYVFIQHYEQPARWSV